MITAKNENKDNPNKNISYDKFGADKNIAEAAKDRLKGIYKDIVVNEVSQSIEASENSLNQYIEEVRTKIAKDIFEAKYDNNEAITQKADEIIEKIDEELVTLVEGKFEELTKNLEDNKIEESRYLDALNKQNSQGFDGLKEDTKQMNSLLDSLEKSLKEGETIIGKDLESFKSLYAETEKTSNLEINKGFKNVLGNTEKEFAQLEEKIEDYGRNLETNLEDKTKNICNLVLSNSEKLTNSIEKLRTEYDESQQKYIEQFKKFQYIIISEAAVIILMLILIIFR